MKKLLLFTIVGVLVFATPNFGAETQKTPTIDLQLLEQSSQAFTAIAEKAIPATVFIKAQLAQSAPEYLNPFDMFNNDFFHHFFQPQPQPQLTGGSGFLVNPNGYIVTNNHVIKNATQITVILNDGREYPATVKGSDSRTDIAVLKIEEQDLPYLTFGDSDALKIGAWVFPVGNPFGLEGTLTKGIVSAKGRQGVGIAPYEDFIQTDAAINPGNSGGPLLNLQGEVVGINTAIFTQSGGYMGIGFSIPSKMAQHVIDQLIDSGTVKRAYLGVVLQPVDKELADAFGLEKQEGVLISEVIKDSPAAKAGLQERDIIIQYNDKAVKNVNKFRCDIAMMRPGTEIKLRVLRHNNKAIQIAIPLGAQSEGEAISAEVIQKLGIEVENFTPEMAARLGYGPEVEGVIIAKVRPNSPAAMTGLRPPFLITAVVANWTDQKKVKNIADFEEALKEVGDKKHLVLLVRHQNRQQYYTVKLN